MVIVHTKKRRHQHAARHNNVGEPQYQIRQPPPEPILIPITVTGVLCSVLLRSMELRVRGVIYLYIERERERERESICVYVYVCVYMRVCVREREREREKETYCRDDFVHARIHTHIYTYNVIHACIHTYRSETCEKMQSVNKVQHLINTKKIRLCCLCSELTNNHGLDV